MSDLTYTPTRQMAQSAAQTANMAYATAREAMEKVAVIAGGHKDQHLLDAINTIEQSLTTMFQGLAQRVVAIEARLRTLEVGLLDNDRFGERLATVERDARKYAATVLRGVAELQAVERVAASPRKRKASE